MTVEDTVNSEIFERILFSWKALKHILRCLKIRDKVSANDRVIFPIRGDFIFMKLPEVSGKLNPHENFRIYSII